jgi:hypothetical protein
MRPFGRFFGRFVGKANFSSGQPPYVHPLSDIVLKEFQSLKPVWFDPAGITFKKDGCFSLTFPLPQSKVIKDPLGIIETAYESKLKSHILTVKAGEIDGQLILFDGSKKPWQTVLDVDSIRKNTQVLCSRLDGLYSTSKS